MRDSLQTMATRTVINTGVPQSIQRGILITLDQDQTQKDPLLDSKRQPQQTTPDLTTKKNNKWYDVEVSTKRGEMSPTFPEKTTTFIDINRNNMKINDHYEISNSLSRIGDNDVEVKETKQQTASHFPSRHFNRNEPTQVFGERGKLALNIVACNGNSGDTVHGKLVGKTPIQTWNVIAPNEFDASVSGASEEQTSRSSNGTTIITNSNDDYDQHKAMKAFNVDIKKTIIQCNVEENNNSNTNGYDHNEGELERHHNEESDRICGSDANTAAAVGVGGGAGQVLCNGLRIVDMNSQQQAKLDDVAAAVSNISRITKADCASAAKQTFENDADHASHVIKIQINPSVNAETVNVKSKSIDKQVTVVQVNENTELKEFHAQNHVEPSVNKLNLGLKMVQKPTTTSLASVTQNGNNGNTSVTELNVSSQPTYLYYTMSSGQFSPCDTLDSGTGSDLESNGTSCTAATTPSPKSINGNHNDVAPKLEMHLKTTKIRINNGNGKSSNKQNGEHQRASSLTDSEESESSSLSCDSLHSAEYIRQSSTSPSGQLSPKSSATESKMLSPFLPHSLLRDIRDRKYPNNDFEVKYGNQQALVETPVETVNAQKIAEEAAEHVKFLQECNSCDNESNGKRASLPPGKTFILNSENGTFIDTKMNSMPRKYEADKYYSFHVNEHENFHSFNSNSSSSNETRSNGNGSNNNGNISSLHDDETSLSEYDAKSLRDDDFAGYKDIRCSSATSTIRSSKGTVRGVKNRVRNGIATFLQMQQPHVKNFIEKDLGKVVLYTTSMGIIRETYAKCSNVKQILRTLLIKFEERDVFMSVEYQAEIKNRMHTDLIRVPQLFVEGQHIGDAETVERLNETGELRQLLKPYKSISTTYTCQTCGGYRLLPCPSCNGSKKSVHRNHFTTEFVALKCMNCDEVGLVKCHNC